MTNFWTAMDSRGPTRAPSDHADTGVRRASALKARTTDELRAIMRRARGWVCDVGGVALDDQSAKLHIPLRERKGDRRSPAVRMAAGELVVSRVEEFLVEGAARNRWFELDGLAYEPDTRLVTIGSDGGNQFALTVERLDVTFLIRPPIRPRS